MNRNWLLFSLMAILPGVAAAQADDSDTYTRHSEQRRKVWNALIPTYGLVQNAGNMGLLSVGSGWHLDRGHHLEISQLVGFVPRYESARAKVTTTLRLRYLPWNLPVGERWMAAPVTVSAYATAIYGHEFWVKVPDRYPEGYYGIPSTAIRVSFAVGQQATFCIPPADRRHARSVSLYYEVGALGRYALMAMRDGDLPLGDILGLSIGIKVQWL